MAGLSEAGASRLASMLDLFEKAMDAGAAQFYRSAQINLDLAWQRFREARAEAETRLSDHVTLLAEEEGV